MDGRCLLGIGAGDLEARGSLYTAEEIVQQPQVWREVVADVGRRREQIDAWLGEKLAMPRVQVLFCGAGTSAFIGETLASWLKVDFESEQPVSFKSVSTTDLVTNPLEFLRDDRPTVMVSFARSGDSPESLATVKLGDQLLSNCYHLVLTCNPEGQLAAYARQTDKAFLLQLPDRTNDRGFAMTSSYTGMLVACASVFGGDTNSLNEAALMAEDIINERLADIASVADIDFKRMVVLGSGPLAGTAREIKLKCIELAAGELVGINDTPLGFRHGPKMIVDGETVVVQLVSNDPYTQQYDRDLLAELKADGTARSVIELSMENLFPEAEVVVEDIWMSLVYVVCGQIFAFLKSYALGVSVDSPCPTGEVNRVVQGVTIHPFK